MAKRLHLIVAKANDKKRKSAKVRSYLKKKRLKAKEYKKKLRENDDD